MKSNKQNNPKKDQHIVSKMIVKRFANNKEYIEKFLIDEKIRIIYDTNETIGKQASIKILKSDFDEKKDYTIRTSNIKNPENIIFCQEYIYSLNYEGYVNDAKKFNKQVIESRKQVMDKLEDHYSVIEGKFSNTLRFIEMPFLVGGNHFENIKKFLTSNELRPKKFFNNGVHKFRKNYIALHKLTERIKFIIIMDRITQFSEQIRKDMDFYELMESSKMFNDSGFYKVKENQNKFISYINNDEEYKKEKFVLILKNTTNLDFILSDNSTSVYYDNYLKFNKILDIIGLSKLKIKPKKINITIVNPKILLVLFDCPIKQEDIVFENINNIDLIKKINSIFYQNTDEWFILKNPYLKKDEIIDTLFYDEIKNVIRESNMLNWLNNSFSGDYHNYKLNLFGETHFNFFESLIKRIDLIVNKSMMLFDNKNLFHNVSNASITNIVDNDLKFFITNEYLACKINCEDTILSSKDFNEHYDITTFKKYYEYYYKCTFDIYIRQKNMIIFIR